MQIGLDIGYSHTKAVSGERRVIFPSVVGTPERPRFSVGEANQAIVLHTPLGRVQVGEGAVLHSRFLFQREDREWVTSEVYHALALAAFSELTAGTKVKVSVVTGLPLAFFEDRGAVRNWLLGIHKINREGRVGQVIEVASCHVIPQPFGAILAETLDVRGKIVNQDLATGTVGLIDIGGKTTNLLAVHKLSEIARETGSVAVGALDAVKAFQDFVNHHYPGLDLRPHQIISAIVNRTIRYYGRQVDLSRVVEDILEPLAAQVLAEATRLWGNGAKLDAILIAGGGGLLLGNYIRKHFRHARLVSDPVFANAIGFYKFAVRVSVNTEH